VPGASTTVSTSASTFPTDIPEEDNNVYFEENGEGIPKLVALNAEFRTDEEREAAEEEDDDDDLDFSNNGPDPEETAAE
jgi:hypothetical protein